jgi:pyridoxal phosphate enzyme (YggS family)
MLSAPQNLPPDQTLAAALVALRQRLKVAADACGRDVDSITLLAVSKGQPALRLRSAIALGLNQFGENYVAEALPKIAALRPQEPVWHFIGRVQANKTRAIAEQFSWVHGIERASIAERLSAQRPARSPPLNVCVQVNVANEASKSGVAVSQCLPLLQAIAKLPRLQVRGLMCMLPYETTFAAQTQGFVQLRQLLQAAQAQGLALDTLSMGMSADLEAAITQGSTLLRVGTALFGARG